MLSAADISIQEVLRFFTARGLDVALLVPTPTGMAKSIMDATGSVRDFLRDAGLHDYEHQPQGTAHKRVLRTRLVTATGIVSTATSLYRPATKQGDPRLWVYGLGQHAEPGNVLALVRAGPQELLVINASDAGLLRGQTEQSDIAAPPAPAGIDLDALLAPLVASSNSIAIELLGLLREIARSWHRGISGVRRDTEVGRLLEELLGISANSSQFPDFKGIEIKAGRASSETRQTLFAKVPNWRLSHLKSSAEILEKFGYKRGDHYEKQLRCTVTSKRPNPQGLYFSVDADQRLLLERSTKPDVPEVVTWRMEDLKAALQKKHPETFWITANTRRIENYEEFRYEHVLHTKKPLTNALPALLEAGVVTMDHLISRRPDDHAKEKGPLFKIWRKDMDLLFPPGELYSLLPQEAV